MFFIFFYTFSNFQQKDNKENKKSILNPPSLTNPRGPPGSGTERGEGWLPCFTAAPSTHAGGVPGRACGGWGPDSVGEEVGE